jgi:hypothetical protein
MRNQVSPRTLPNLLGVSEKAITQLAKKDHRTCIFWLKAKG